MATIAEQILNQLAARLKAIPGYDFADDPVLDPDDSIDPPLIVLESGGELASAEQLFGLERWTLSASISVVIAVIDHPDSDLSSAGFRADFEAAKAAIHAAVWSDPYFAGLAFNTINNGAEGPRKITFEGAKSRVVGVVNYGFEYFTDEGDLTQTG